MVLYNKNTNYNSIDLAKFVCAILVVMIHVAPFDVAENSGVLFSLNFLFKQSICRIAVPLFFVFSGFFLYKKTPLENFSLHHTKAYVTRLFHLYIIWSCIYFPLYMKNSLETQTLSDSLINYIRDFAFSGSYTQLWYLNALMLAVVIVSFLLSKKIPPTKILCISFAFYVVGLLGDGYAGIIAPLYWFPKTAYLLNRYYEIFDTTRNGLFFAFFFVAVGMILSNKEKPVISMKKSLFFFIVSLCALCIETQLLKLYGLARDYNVIMFTIPTVLFCFSFLSSLKLKNRKIYKNLRILSSLIFYLHLLVSYWVWKAIVQLKIDIINTPIMFISTLTLTIALSIAILNISKLRPFRFLQRLY